MLQGLEIGLPQVGPPLDRPVLIGDLRQVLAPIEGHRPLEGLLGPGQIPLLKLGASQSERLDKFLQVDKAGSSAIEEVALLSGEDVA